MVFLLCYFFSFVTVCNGFFSVTFSFVTESHKQQTMTGAIIVFSRDQLIALSKPRLLPGAWPVIPVELRRRARGCRSGAKRRAKTRKYKPSVPAIITGNVRSLANKTDALVKTERVFRECSLMCFTETWLHADFPDHSASMPGFRTVRADRDVTLSGKKRGGGIAVYVNERWCNPDHVCVKELSVARTLNC